MMHFHWELPNKIDNFKPVPNRIRLKCMFQFGNVVGQMQCTHVTKGTDAQRHQMAKQSNRLSPSPNHRTY
ncbi:hypothetical protein X947_2663 [Burkholderia pseudomallei MSHR7334]|nr:hypothetical protein X947_2663 [Burkholderia pseudomallei MSHR7334]